MIRVLVMIPVMFMVLCFIPLAVLFGLIGSAWKTAYCVVDAAFTALMRDE